MPLFQVTCRELVYVDRTYEVEAMDAEDAKALIAKSQGDEGELIEEVVQDTYEFCGVRSVDSD
jgi:hypothetical protein